MFASSLNCLPSVFQRYHSSKHFSEFYPQDGGENKLSWHRYESNRAALTGKHDTLVRRARGWQGAPDGQQAKN